MRHDDEARAQFLLERERQLEHTLGGMPVEISGGFVGQQAGGPCDQSTRECRPLTFTAGELARPVS
jgi:hypothetical protein